jgi:hypothetical protein
MVADRRPDRSGGNQRNLLCHLVTAIETTSVALRSVFVSNHFLVHLCMTFHSHSSSCRVAMEMSRVGPQTLPCLSAPCVALLLPLLMFLAARGTRPLRQGLWRWLPFCVSASTASVSVSPAPHCMAHTLRRRPSRLARWLPPTPSAPPAGFAFHNGSGCCIDTACQTTHNAARAGRNRLGVRPRRSNAGVKSSSFPCGTSPPSDSPRSPA